MPKTNYHLEKDNAVEKRFWGKVPVYRATSYFHFYKGSPFRQLLHELKYRGNKEIGRVMGRFAGIDLLDTDDFASIDVIVPVPLHPKKQLKRGYNQSEWIARGLSEALNKPVDTTHLIRIKENATQTKKSVFERYQNTQGIFALNDVTVFEKKHILLVDDVLTTGSTLEACALALMESSFVKISVFTLALA
jgi:ComF family protein